MYAGSLNKISQHENMDYASHGSVKGIMLTASALFLIFSFATAQQLYAGLTFTGYLSTGPDGQNYAACQQLNASAGPGIFAKVNGIENNVRLKYIDNST